MFSRGGLSHLTFLEVICLPTALSSLINLHVFTRAVYSFLRTITWNIVKDGGKRRRLQICYSPVYCCAIVLVPGSKEEVSAKAQVACYSKSEKKN